MPTLTRPMFSNQAQNGGIVSTLPPQAPGMTPEAQTLPPEARPQAQAQAQGMMGSALQGPIDSAVAEEVAATNMELDSAETVDEILAAMGGTASSTEEARTELATIVGEQDANNTPESVLPITQTTLQLVAAVESTNGQGGLGNLLGAPGELTANTMGTPLGDPTNPLAAPTMEVPAEGFQPVAGFFQGGLSGTPPIYGPGSNPLLTTVPTDDPTTLPAVNPTAAAVDPTTTPVDPTAAAISEPYVPQYPALSGWRGHAPSVFPPGAQMDEAGAPRLVSSGTGWNIPSATARGIDVGRMENLSQYYKDFITPSLPEVEPVEERIKRRIDAYGEYLPDKDRTTRDIIEEQRAVMGEYLTKPLTYEEALAQRTEDYGDTQKDFETQAWLHLAQFGAHIATSNKSPFYAIAKALPYLAEGMSTVAKEKSILDRTIRKESRDDVNRLKENRNQQELALAQGAFERVRGLKDEYNTLQRTLRDQAVTTYEHEMSDLAKLTLDLGTGALQWGQVLASEELSTLIDTEKHRDSIVATYAQIPAEYYMKENKETGEWEPFAGRFLPHGLFDLAGNYEADPNIIKIDASTYAARTGTGLIDPQKIDVVLFGDEYGGEQGWEVFGGSYDGGTGKYYVDIDGENVHLDENFDWVPGDADSIQRIDHDETGRTYITNKHTGYTHQVQQRRRNPETGEMEIITVTPRAGIGVDEKHPYSEEMSPSTVPVEFQTAAMQAEIMNSINEYESASIALENHLSEMMDFTGPEAGFRRLGTGIAAFLPPGKWNDWFTNVNTERGRAQWLLVTETLVRAQVPSTRYPEGQVQYVRNELGELPRMFREPEAARARFMELLRETNNNYSQAVSRVSGNPYYYQHPVPTGGINDAFNFADPRARLMVQDTLKADDERIRATLEDKWVFYPVPEGKDAQAKEYIESNPQLGMPWSEPQGRQHGKGRGIWYQIRLPRN